MYGMNEVANAAETLARAFEEYKSTNDQRMNELESRGRADGLYDEKLKRLDMVMNRLQDDVSSVKTTLRRPLAGSPLVSAEANEQKQAFIRYVTKGVEPDANSLSTKASVMNDQDGGYLVPEAVADRIITRQFDVVPMRKLATIMSITSEAVEILRDTNEAEASWVGETATRSDTAQGDVGRTRIAVHELHAQPKATQKLLDDAVMNVEDWLINKVVNRFARREADAFINGDGLSQPRGVCSYSTAATGDDTRAWGVLEHVATGVNADFSSTSPADTLITLMHKLKAGYLNSAAWMMPRSVAEKIRKMKESTTSNYLWQPGLQAGQPATLLGFPIYLAEEMPALATGSLSLAFGNFQEGYTIVDRIGLRILRDPYTSAPFVKFRCSKRVGGDVTNFEAIKLLKFGT